MSKNKNKTCIIQGLIENQKDFLSIPKGSQTSRNKEFKKNNVIDRHVEDHVINIFDRDIHSSNRFSALTDNKGGMTNKQVEDHVITIPNQDTVSLNQFSAVTNNNDDISVTKIGENSEKLGLKRSSDNIPE